MDFNPFLKNAKEILVNTPETKEVQFRLKRLQRTCGFGVLTGPAGCGKTTMVRYWSRSLSEANFRIYYSSLATLTVMEFYRNLVLEMGAEPAFHKTRNFRIIQSEVNRLSIEKHITPVFILDEAQQLSAPALGELKSLFNFEMDSKDRAIILLVGLPQLNYTLRQNIQETLRQRICMNYNMENLSKEEGCRYIQEKLKGAGCTQTVFEEGAVNAILNAANGVPRMISKYCNAALVVGESMHLNVIHTEAALQAIDDCELG